MANLFISYSSSDRAVALDVKRRLHARGHEGVFLDFHPEDGIPAGRTWESELRRRITMCRGVIVLCTPRSMDSKWVFAEIHQAKSLYKHIFPVEIEPCTPISTLAEFQMTSVATEGEAAWERIWTGLAAAGIDARDDFAYRVSLPCGARRSPYPGLRAYDEDDAAVFSGRGPEIAEALALIEQLHGGESAALVVVGASGSGKSSLVRAGIVPRLRKDRARWFVIGPMRLRGDPRGELDRALAIAQPELGLAAPAGPRSADELVAALGACCAAARRDPARRDRAVLLVLDQMEEVFSLAPPIEAERFLDLVDRALAASAGWLHVLGSIQTPFLHQLQIAPQWKGRHLQTMSLGRLPESRLTEVVERPATVAGIDWEPDLVKRIVRLVPTSDALPLLSFALARMYDASDRMRFVAANLAAAVDDLEHLLGSVAESAVGAAPEGGDVDRRLASFFLRFVRMHRVDGALAYAREPVPRAELPRELEATVMTLVASRLLTDEGGLLEVAHEALFRTWPRMVRWIRENIDFLEWREGLRSWVTHNSGDHRQLLTGPALSTALAWSRRHHAALSAAEKTFIRDSEWRRRWIRIAVVAGSALAVAVATYFVLALARSRTENAYATRRAEWEADQRALGTVVYQQGAADDPLSRILDLEAYAATRPADLRAIRAGSLLFMTPFPSALMHHVEQVSAVAISPDGQMIAAGDRGGTIRLWRVDGTGPSHSIREQSAPLALQFSNDGETLFAGFVGGTVAWYASHAAGPLVRSDKDKIEILHEAVRSISLPRGTRLVAAIGANMSLQAASLDRAHVDEVAAGFTKFRDGAPGPLWDGPGPVPRDAEVQQLWSASGRRAAIVRADGNAAIASLEGDGDAARWRVASLVDPGRRVKFAAISPDGAWAVTLSSIVAKDGIEELMLWDVARASRSRVLYTVQQGMVWTLGAAFSADSQRIAVTTFASGVTLWDVIPGPREPASELNIDGPRRSATFSPSGDRIALEGVRDDVLWTKLDAASTTVLSHIVRSASDFTRGAGYQPASSLPPMFAPDGSFVVTTHGANVSVWRPAMTREGDMTWGQIAQVIRARTTACQSPSHRISAQIGWLEATAAFEACEHRYGRATSRPKR